MKSQSNTLIPVEQKQFFFLTKWKKIGGIAGCSWALISLVLWSQAAKVEFMVAKKVPEDSRADFNHNGRVDVGDAAKISLYLANKISTL